MTLTGEQVEYWQQVTTQVGEKLWTTFDVADRFGVHVESVRRWVRKGQLKPIRLGGPTGDRFPESEIQRFMKAKRINRSELAS